MFATVLSKDIWTGAILGAVLGSIIIPVVLSLMSKVKVWWFQKKPQTQLLQGIIYQSEPCRIFVRDFFIKAGTELISVEPRLGVGTVPNVRELWPDCEGRAVASIFNVLGKVGKTKNIEIIRMSQDVGEWNSHVFVLGAQAKKSFDFYRHMNNVAYQMDNKEIYDVGTGKIIPREHGFGYGIILKVENPFKATGKKGVGFLIGGFGVLGTSAAAYYFREHFVQLGKEFGKDCFGILVRAPVTAGEQAVQRLKQFDKR
ncbi:unnamed protein product, partial [marine sediment metagenome]